MINYPRFDVLLQTLLEVDVTLLITGLVKQ